MTKRVCRRGTSAGSFLLKCLAVEQFPEHIFSSCHQAAELFTLLSVSPSAPSCHSSRLQAQKDKTPSVVVSACSLAFPHTSKEEKNASSMMKTSSLGAGCLNRDWFLQEVHPRS